MDEELRGIVLTGDYQKILPALRRAGKTHLLKNKNAVPELRLHNTPIVYLYRLVYSRPGERRGICINSNYINGLIDGVAKAIDEDRVTLSSIGYFQERGDAYSFRDPHGSITAHWKLTLAPYLEILGKHIMLSKSEFAPHFKVRRGADVRDILSKGGAASKKIGDIESNRRRALENRQREEREKREKDQRRTRISAFKEILAVDKNAAKIYMDAIKDDTEFTKIAEILYNKAQI